VSWINAIAQGILLGGLFAMFACGLSLLFGVIGVINLAHGDFAVLGAYVAIAIIPSVEFNALWAVLFVIPIFAVLGYAIQRTILQRSIEVDPLTSLLVTFGLSVIIENALLQKYSNDSQSLNVGGLVRSALHVNDQISLSWLNIGILVLAVVVLSGLQLFLGKTSTGRQIRAVADDREAAEIAGVRTQHIAGVAAAIAFATVALAGLSFGSVQQFSPYSGSVLLLFSSEAVIIGGLGSLWGTLAGGILLGVAQTVGAQIDPSSGQLAGHLVFLAVLVLRPSGLFPSRVTA
jgi:branched-chain amino acid transport system permease protein